MAHDVSRLGDNSILYWYCKRSRVLCCYRNIRWVFPIFSCIRLAQD